MSRIIAGRFETQAQSAAAVVALEAAGIGPSDIYSFYVSPPGQHAIYPLGGDAHHDEGTKESGRKAGAGAAVGSVTGLALGTATGAALGEPGFTVAGALAGAGIGGYVGSLAGGLMGSRSGNPDAASTAEPVERSSGMMVAVCVDHADETQALAILRERGALELERAAGEWRDGAWVDFDARRTPQLIDGAGSGPQGPAGPRA